MRAKVIEKLLGQRGDVESAAEGNYMLLQENGGRKLNS